MDATNLSFLFCLCVCFWVPASREKKHFCSVSVSAFFKVPLKNIKKYECLFEWTRGVNDDELTDWLSHYHHHHYHRDHHSHRLETNRCGPNEMRGVSRHVQDHRKQNFLQARVGATHREFQRKRREKRFDVLVGSSEEKRCRCRIRW